MKKKQCNKETKTNNYSIDKIKFDNKITRLELEAIKILSQLKENEKKEKVNLESKINELIKTNLVVTKQLEELSLIMGKLVVKK